MLRAAQKPAALLYSIEIRRSFRTSPPGLARPISVQEYLQLNANMAVGCGFNALAVYCQEEWSLERSRGGSTLSPPGFAIVLAGVLFGEDWPLQLHECRALGFFGVG